MARLIECRYGRVKPGKSSIACGSARPSLRGGKRVGHLIHGTKEAPRALFGRHMECRGRQHKHLATTLAVHARKLRWVRAARLLQYWPWYEVRGKDSRRDVRPRDQHCDYRCLRVADRKL